jgi:hypothetical protein
MCLCNVAPGFRFRARAGRWTVWLCRGPWALGIGFSGMFVATGSEIWYFPCKILILSYACYKEWCEMRDGVFRVRF